MTRRVTSRWTARWSAFARTARGSAYPRRACGLRVLVGSRGRWLGALALAFAVLAVADGPGHQHRGYGVGQDLGYGQRGVDRGVLHDDDPGCGFGQAGGPPDGGNERED